MCKTNKSVYDLAAALRYMDEGYRLLTTAGIKEIDEGDIIGMQHDLQRARVSFAKFGYRIKCVDDLNYAIRVYAKQNGMPVRFLYDKIVNNMDLNGYTLKNKKQTKEGTR